MAYIFCINQCFGLTSARPYHNNDHSHTGIHCKKFDLSMYIFLEISAFFLELSS